MCFNYFVSFRINSSNILAFKYSLHKIPKLIFSIKFFSKQNKREHLMLIISLLNFLRNRNTKFTVNQNFIDLKQSQYFILNLVSALISIVLN